MKQTRLVLVSMAVLALALCASVSWGAVGIYQWSADQYLPANITYMLSGDVASVTISLVPKGATTPVVWSVTKTTPDTETLRGKHTVVWDGSGGTYGSQYDAIVTIVNKVMPADTVTPLWETDVDTSQRTFHQCAMNTRVPTPGSPNPYYGRVYAANYLGFGGKTVQRLEMYNPDGSYIGAVPFAWVGGSAPFGLSIDADDHVWVTDRSKQWLYRFDPDGTNAKGPYACGYSRGLGVTGSGATFRAAIQGWGATKFWMGDGENADGLIAGAYLTNAFVAASPFALYWSPTGQMIAPSVDNATGGRGGLIELKADGTAGVQNVTIARPTGMFTASDGSVFVSRCPAWAGDPDNTIAYYQFPAGTDMMTVDAAVTVPNKYTITTNRTGGNWKFPKFLTVDPFGSILSSVGFSATSSYCFYMGLYSLPDAGTTVTQKAGTITDAYQPKITNVNPASIQVTADGVTQVPVDVTVYDLGGIGDIASVKIIAPYGSTGPRTFTGTFLSGSGNEAIYRVMVKAMPGDTVGIHTATVRASNASISFDAPMSIHVSDGRIAGRVCASVLSSFAVAGATVTANGGGTDIQTGTTAADGSFTIDATGGKTYTVSVAKAGWSATTTQQVSAVHFTTVNLAQDLTLAPISMHDVLIVGTERRSNNQNVAVTAIVRRQSAQDGRNGVQDYYVLADPSTPEGCLVKQITTDPYFSEGDLLLVEGTWSINSGDKDGYIVPAVPPVLLSSGNAYPDPIQAYYDDLPDYNTNDARAWGGYVKMDNVKVIAPAIAQVMNPMEWGGVTYRFSDFCINVPKNATDPTTTMVKVEIDTLASVGCYYPEVGDYVNLKGFVAWTDVPWGFYGETTSTVIKVGKPSDVVFIPPVFAGGAKDLPDGSVAKLKGVSVVTAVLPDGVLYIESQDRSGGIRVHGTLPTAPPMAVIGVGDRVSVDGVMATTTGGERFIETALPQHSIARLMDLDTNGNPIPQSASLRPLDALGMNNRDAAKAPGMFVKIWGKVKSVGADNFVISDGSAEPIKVVSGTLTKPDADTTVRVRGVMSKDESGPVLLMRNEQVDWTYGSETYQALPFTSAFGYAPEFLVLGPFQDPSCIPAIPLDPDSEAAARDYRLTHDFISDATGTAFTEMTIADMKPKPGGMVGTKTWTRSAGANAHVAFATAAGQADNSVFYAHIWVYSPVQLDGMIRIGSDDSSKIIVTGYIGAYESYVTMPATGRGETYGQDLASWVPFAAGWNSLLIKVENGGGPSGLDILILDSTSGNESLPGWGNAKPLPGMGLGYLLEKPIP